MKLQHVNTIPAKFYQNQKPFGKKTKGPNLVQLLNSPKKIWTSVEITPHPSQCPSLHLREHAMRRSMCLCRISSRPRLTVCTSARLCAQSTQLTTIVCPLKTTTFRVHLEHLKFFKIHEIDDPHVSRNIPTKC